MEHLLAPPAWEHIVTSIRDGSIITITDGSFDPETNLATAC